MIKHEVRLVKIKVLIKGKYHSEYYSLWKILIYLTYQKYLFYLELISVIHM